MYDFQIKLEVMETVDHTKKQMYLTLRGNCRPPRGHHGKIRYEIQDARDRLYLVHLKYWTLNLMPLMVYPKVLFHPNFSIKV